MEENNDFKQKISTSAEELKNETSDAVKQVKENMKNVNVKEEAKATKGFITEMFKNPLGKIHEIANDSSNKYFKTALVLVIVWSVVVLLKAMNLSYFSWSRIGSILLNYIKVILAPLVSVIAMSVIIFIMNKNAKKSLITVITTVVTAKLPIILAKVISLLTIISSNISTITNEISTLGSVVSIALMYFAIRDLFDEQEEQNAFKKFVGIQVIYSVVAFVFYYLGIHI